MLLCLYLCPRLSWSVCGLFVQCPTRSALILQLLLQDLQQPLPMGMTGCPKGKEQKEMRIWGINWNGKWTREHWRRLAGETLRTNAGNEPDFGFSQSGPALPISGELFLIYSNINEIRSRSSAFRKPMHLTSSISPCVCVHTHVYTYAQWYSR